MKDLKTKFNRYDLTALVLFLFLLIYLVFRPYQLYFVIGVSGIAFLLGRRGIAINNLFKRFFDVRILTLIALVYLTSCALYFRDSSADGLNLYIKNVLTLRSSPTIFYYEFPYYPYFVELVLGFFLRVFNTMMIVNIMFGVATILSIYATYYLYRQLNVDSPVSRFALFLLISSPVFIHFAFFQFKIELFLLVFSNLMLLLFISSLHSPSMLKSFLLGMFMSVSFLTKVTALPLVFSVLIFSFIELFFHKDKLKRFLNIILVVLVFFLGVFVWTVNHGINIFPGVMFNRDLSSTPYEFFDLNKDVRAECFSEATRESRSEMFFDETFLNRTLQPLYYLRGVTADGNNYDFTFYNPGPFLYIGILLFVFLPVLIPRKFFHDRKYIYLFLMTALNILIFFLIRRTHYWYLLPSFPIVALFVSMAIFERDQAFHIKVIKFLVIFISIYYLFLGGLGYLNNFLGQQVSGYSGYFPVYKVNEMLNKAGPKKRILLASERPFNIPVPYVTNSDKRVIYSYYYFASANKPLSQIYNELKEKEFDYIVVFEQYLNDYRYIGCRKENNRILSEFLNTYTRPIYKVNGSNVIFEII